MMKYSREVEERCTLSLYYSRLDIVKRGESKIGMTVAKQNQEENKNEVSIPLKDLSTNLLLENKEQ